MLKAVNQASKPDTKPPQFSNCPGGDGGGDTIYESDEFRMYSFKIRRCTKTRAHSWTECPYAHRGEKAQRRDPRKFNYSAITCPEFRRGGCRRGDSCQFAHGVFEFWLHPTRYRTLACMAGKYCRRKVCFFAHTPEQMRIGTMAGLCHCIYRICANSPPVAPENEFGKVADRNLVKGMRELKKEADEEKVERCFGDEMSDFPDIDWISELVS